MEQHPIPQNISSYEFRLVGDMTLKQFFQLAGGILVGLLIYRLPLTNFIKFPLIFVAVMIGVALAFIPINSRPFSRWIVAFLRAIYSPTEYIWQPTSQVTPPVVSPISPPPQSQPIINAPIPAIIPDATPAIETKSVPAPTDKAKETAFVKVTTVTPPPPVTPPPTEAKPKTDTTVFSSDPSLPETLDSQPLPESYSPPPSLPSQIKTLPSVNTPQTQVKPTPRPTTGPAVSTNQLTPPSTPNILSGLITQPDTSPIEGAIVEIIDSSSGIPARALRTNRLGQFQIATPLTAGTYTLQTEKDGYSFAPVSVVVDNHIITPVIITGQNV